MKEGRERERERERREREKGEREEGEWRGNVGNREWRGGRVE